ncbi:hypothetical protein [Micromonospora phaseoli]|nr:hypothetical protein [Micromonospora phaseoli]
MIARSVRFTDTTQGRLNPQDGRFRTTALFPRTRTDTAPATAREADR